ncbi:glycosyl transferase family 90-domain-containing protein [Aspergillus candidus]|uniref:Glycosyl transferase family 90-domain-containing protein n=1 Tax=Aspergillus candidus TaxID=41067 RepID=A0A2I2EZS2_ASPCN|nr:glycosyl transferase family 90-domain-containing protein [Aspergillus candidus]PLB33876.1 glycosyl transferase family 90-domain-containing protein [Aspergillus candidus]
MIPPSSRVCSQQRILLTALIAICGIFIYLMWHGMNSDRDNVHPIITQLIPAGHCTCQTSTSFECADCLTCLDSQNSSSNAASSNWTYEYDRDNSNLSLNKDQCSHSFPGLFQDVYRGGEYWKQRGGVSYADLEATPLEKGMARAIIHNGELYVVAVRTMSEDHRRKIVATLSAMYRALAASPDRSTTPNIEFIFSVEDRVDDVDANDHPVWVFSRKASEESVWLIPDFGFWSWGHLSNDIGPYTQAIDKIQTTEAERSFLDKEKKLVWRGKLSFAPKLRRALLDIARNQVWGDVKEVDWSRKANFLPMEEHCRYMFIAHVEGRAYSASLKYRQACRSVIVAHKLQYIEHHHYLLVPSGPHQNYVEVERDFSDLPKAMDHLLQNPEKAQEIADNNVKTFRERYLTQAAEACYWRALWDGWAEATANMEQPSVPVYQRGLRYESFLLLDSRDMLQFSFAPDQ